MSRLRNPFAWLAVLLALLVAGDAARTFPTPVGIDFYAAHGRWDGPSWCVAASYAALSSPLLAVLLGAGQLGMLRLVMFLSWLPLVPAAYSRLAPPRART